MTHINVVETIDKGVKVMVHVHQMATTHPALATVPVKHDR